MIEKIKNEIDKLDKKLKSADITHDQFVGWKSSPVTKLLLSTLLDEYLSNMEFVVRNPVTDDLSMVNDAFAKGEMKALETIMEWDPVTEENPDEDS